MSSLPEWLRAHLTDIGADNPDGIARGARMSTCPSCGRRVLRGLDDDRCAMVATADPHEIDEVGEYLALRIGLLTYSLRRATNSSGKATWNLDPRTQWAIAGGRNAAVVAEHRCGMSIPPAAQPRLFVLCAPKPNTNTPPF
jgi:hypothetical protein